MSYKPVPRIAVHIWGQVAGYVALDPTLGYYVFQYTDQFARTGIQLAPIHMRLRSAPGYVFPNLREQTYRRLPAMLADSLPDAWGNVLVDAYLTKHGLRKEEITALDRLAYINRRAMGALEFVPSRSGGRHRPTAIELADLVESARQAITGTVNDELSALASFRQLIAIGSSAGGARAKGVIAWNRKTNEIRSGQFDVPPGFEHFIIKFDGVKDAQEAEPKIHGRVEYAYFLMAQAAGIDMMECRLFEENGRAHFMTKRFDRDGNEKHHTQTLTAINHCDFQLLNTYDYSVLFDTIRDLELGEATMIEAARRMVFNRLSANADDHPKNFSFILKQNSPWALAPAYDITHSYRPDSKWTSQHFMSINGKFRDVTRSDMVQAGSRFSIPGMKDIIDKARSAVADWPGFADQAGISKADTERIAKDHQLL